MKFLKIAGLVGLLLIAGCTSDIQRMAAVQATGGSAFTQALTEEYRTFVAHEANEDYDWKAADYYARKGLAAAGGEVVLPEEVTGVSDGHAGALNEARSRLMAALDSGARDGNPTAAAQAQVAFDCWLHETQEVDGWLASGALGEDHFAECRDRFEAAMLLLAPKPETPIAAPPAVAPHEYLVYFDLDKVDIRPDARAVIDEVLADAAAQGIDRVRISATGHADRSGSEEYNLALSMRRADAVREALIAGGIPAENITLAARGESENAIPTVDGVVEQANRRVEIIVQ
jgi:OOP family OmpA-OmpF porin